MLTITLSHEKTRSSYVAGETIRIVISTADEDAAAADPESLVASILLPDGSEVAMELGGTDETDGYLTTLDTGSFLVACPSGSVAGAATISAKATDSGGSVFKARRQFLIESDAATYSDVAAT